MINDEFDKLDNASNVEVKKKSQKTKKNVNSEIAIEKENNEVNVLDTEDTIVNDVEKVTAISDEKIDKLKDKLTVSKIKKRKNKKNKEVKALVRYESNISTGLSQEQVDERIEDGLVNQKQIGSTKSIKKIIFGNLFSTLNMLTFGIAGWLISVGALKDLMFLPIISANIIIGIIQEIKAKKIIDKLSIISSPSVDVLRNGNKSEIGINDIVLDDIICLENGKQICSDSIVLDGMVEVNEALLTGESDSIVKKVGDRLLSGSFVVSGNCKARVDAIGKDNYIETLTLQAKKYKKPKSELLKTLKYIIWFMIIIIIPIGVSLFFLQYERFMGSTDYVTSVRKTAGAIIGMIPSGMYLLTSISLAIGVIKLSQNKVLVQELYCIEMLARVNVLCLDKTGTITDGTMAIKNVIDYNSIGGMSTKNIIGAFLNATNDTNMTNKVLEDYFGRSKRLKQKEVIPFSSQRKLSAVTFEKLGTFILGAPEFVMRKNYRLIESDVVNGSNQGYRVLVLAHTQEAIENNKLPDTEFSPVALILIEDTIRPDAIKTIQYFKNAGVEVKVISGDNPLTVSKVSERAGIDRANEYISLDGLNDSEVERAALKYTVFGRVSPAQKKLLVKTLKDHDKVVAMTGDGVNDILALKEADCSIAVASGSEAARNVSHLVLLDSNFDSMPKVVGEGRRVINNVTKVSCLFLTKTIFSLLLAIYALNRGGAYPISTNQLIMIDILCIGVPSFVLILEPNDKRATGKFFTNVLKGALPGAIVILINSMLVFGLADNLNMNNQLSSTVIVVIATFTCMMVLFQTCRPFNTLKKTMYAFLFTAFVFITLLMPKFLDFNPIISGGAYYDADLKVETVSNIPSVEISQDDHYVIDGVYTNYYDYNRNEQRKIFNAGGYLNIDGIAMTDIIVSPRISFTIPKSSSEKQYYVLESFNTGIKVSDTGTTLTMNSEGSIFINGVYARYNILPTVKIKDGFYIINGVTTSIKTDIADINKINVKNNEIYVNDKGIGYIINTPSLSVYNDYYCLGGVITEVPRVDSPSIEVTEDLFYIINEEKTDIKYSVNVTISDKDYYVIDSQYTNNQATPDRKVYKLSVTDDGYLKVNGVLTDYRVEMIYTVGGNVQRVPLDAMLLMLLLCILSWPLMALLKEIIPWCKRQLNLALKILNKF